MKLVLLSGWAVDARIWRPLAPHWSTDVDVATPDWPGMGQHPALPVTALDADHQALATAMAGELPQDAIWVGWSLGALQATTLAHRLPSPRGLILLGMGSGFCHPQGVTEADLTSFRNAFERSPDKARRHFLRWQLSGEPSPGNALRLLGELVDRNHLHDVDTLASGLEWLANCDITESLATLSCPVRHLCGDRDPLLAESVRHAMDARLANAGHCPMVSQPAPLARLIEDQARFIEESLQLADNKSLQLVGKESLQPSRFSSRKQEEVNS
ncbi:alpha/beta fold hydrolase [Halomonas cupida]|uniref:alpha/beta fold hydrolase n=1 Tax=Halomonas cupida TaxID=44933 RepID=UPI003A9359D6